MNSVDAGRIGGYADTNQRGIFGVGDGLSGNFLLMSFGDARGGGEIGQMQLQLDRCRGAPRGARAPRCRRPGPRPTVG